MIPNSLIAKFPKLCMHKKVIAKQWLLQWALGETICQLHSVNISVKNLEKSQLTDEICITNRKVISHTEGNWLISNKLVKSEM